MKFANVIHFLRACVHFSRVRALMCVAFAKRINETERKAALECRTGSEAVRPFRAAFLSLGYLKQDNSPCEAGNKNCPLPSLTAQQERMFFNRSRIVAPVYGYRSHVENEVRVPCARCARGGGCQGGEAPRHIRICVF